MAVEVVVPPQVISGNFLFREAWKSLGKMNKKEAMSEYICEVQKLYPDWEDAVKVKPFNLFFIAKLVFRSCADIFFVIIAECLLSMLACIGQFDGKQ